MLNKKNIPVLIGIILLSGMFLVGQESWPPKPQINHIDPPDGCNPDQISIVGSNFGVEQTDVSKIIFCGTDAGDAVSWSDSLIDIVVPSGLYNGDCPVTVNIGGQVSNEYVFTIDCVLTPVLEGVSINGGGGLAEETDKKVRCVIGQSGVIGKGSDVAGTVQISAGTIYAQEANIE